MTSHNVKVEGIHIELTNKCTLKCSRCARTTFIEKFGTKKWKNFDIDHDDLMSFLDIDLTGMSVYLCGNYGDPIYHNDIIGIVKSLKLKNANISIVTNGSYKTEKWWKLLTAELTSSDEIAFSIDGLPNNFTQYRTNADWPSIEIAIKTVVLSNVKTSWRYIPFSFNENDINSARDFALSSGIDEFIITPSDRWIENDWLKPKNYFGPVQNQKFEWNNGVRDVEINPKCYGNKMHFISAEGYYMPCCLVGDWRFFYKSEFFKNKDHYDISKTTITNLLTTENLTSFYNNIKVNKLEYCTFNCPK
jgi:MoaA/NifB/PqqE/SkfB family radical SAM enzyme